MEVARKKTASILVVTAMLSTITCILATTSLNPATGTIVGASHITGNEIWNQTNSPYIIQGNVTVDPGANLTIEPGVEVLFDGGYNLYVEGSLYAVGNQSSYIKFTTNLPFPLDEDRFNIQVNASGRAIIWYANITAAYYGITFQGSYDNDVRYNIFKDNFGGILLELSWNNTVSENLITDNIETGLLLRDSYDNKITDNNISYNFKGVNIYRSSKNLIRSNIIHHNFNQGILLFLANTTNIEYNQVFDNQGSGIEISQSDMNVIFSNNLSHNGNSLNESGIYIGANCELNLIYHNTLFFNFKNGFDSTNRSNLWDAGYPLGGNFWSNFAGIDSKRGANQDIPGSDGLGDSVLWIDDDSLDRYPLMTPLRNIAPFLIALISPANGSVVRPGMIIDLDILAQSFNSVNYSLNAGANVSITAPFDITVDSVNWTEGENRFNVSVIDGSGNVNMSWFMFVFDSLPPAISLVSPLNNSLIVAGVKVNLSIDDPNMNFALYSLNNASFDVLLYPYDLNTSLWADGNHTLQIYAEDLSGNNDTQVYNLTVDSTPPKISYGAMGQFAGRYYIRPEDSVEVSVKDEHFSSASYVINGGLSQPLEDGVLINTSSFLDGDYQITVRANDTLGNLNISNINLTIDSVPPQIVLNDPQNNSLIRAGYPLNFSAVDSNPITFRYSLNSGSESIHPYPYIINTSGFGNIQYMIFVNVSDYAGNQNSSWYTFTVDSLKPVIILKGLQNNTFIKPGTGITLEIYEPNLAFLNYSVNGESEALASPFIINTSKWPDDVYSIEVFALDKTGNFAREIFGFVVDGTPPNVVSSNPKNRADWVSPRSVVRIKFSEPMDENSLVYALSISPMVPFIPKITQDNLTLILEPTMEFSNKTEYTVILNASAADRAGNQLGKDFVLTFKTGTKEEEDMNWLVLFMLVLIIVFILVAIILFLASKKGAGEEGPVDDEFGSKKHKGPKELDEDLIEEGLGKDEDIEEDKKDIGEDDQGKEKEN